jgi:multimeric flavodoxin WrbA
MKTLLLDAAPAGDARTTRAADALAASLDDRGHEVERVVLRDLNVKPCSGCFGCWVSRPGECVFADDARSVAEKAIASDALALVSPVTFGSYGSLAKGVLDRMICLILPHFTMIGGEVHHKPRYRRYPVLLALGTLAEPDPEQEALFARLVERNAVNLYNPEHVVAVVAGDSDAHAVAGALLDNVSLCKGVAA